MTTAETTPSNADKLSALEHAVNGVPVLRSSTTGFDSAAAAPAADPPRRRDRGVHRRRPGRWQTIGNREISHDRRPRLRLLAGSLIGAGCLVLAYRLQPDERSPFAAPSGTVGWIALIAGIAGIWLVPGLWLSAVMMRIGAGSVARLANRIGTTLAWYAVVGTVIHVSAQGALVTTGGIVGATVAATAAVCLGVALGLVRHPANPTLRFLMAALAGGICAQTVIWLSMLLFTYGVNYEHIRRLDWLVVLACALLTAIGAHSRPDLPLVRTAGHIRTVLITLAVVTVTAVALLATGSRWSPAQRMPSAIGAEQVAAPPGADVAFGLTAIGPEGAELIQRAVFTASDDTGRPVPVVTQLVLADGSAHPAMLLVMLQRSSQPALCGNLDFAGHLGGAVGTVRLSEKGAPVKLTLRDQASGVLVQAVIPAGWCAP
jgi:hypothetical protein